MTEGEKNNAATNKTDMELRGRVEAALDQIRPAIEMDGGYVELGDIVDGIAYVEMKGACGGCPSSMVTLKSGIERIVKDQVPEIKAVVAVDLAEQV